jgi:hypothetical protein
MINYNVRGKIVTPLSVKSNRGAKNQKNCFEPDSEVRFVKGRKGAVLRPN